MLKTRTNHAWRDDLLDRRRRLAGAIADVPGGAGDLVRLLGEVDDALQRLGTPEFSCCAVCGDSVENEWIDEHPGMPYCLCEFSDEQLEGLSRDLDMARRLQASLLPRQDQAAGGWTAHYRYVAAGPVSGDYCDVQAAPGDDSSLHFFVGDVCGKGVAASLVMAHLNAWLRSQVRRGAPVRDLVRDANAHLCENLHTTHFTTLLAGRADARGCVEVANAGHCKPVILRAGGVERLNDSGFPLGVVPDADYDMQATQLAPGESLILHSDGLTDACNADGKRYGAAALERVLHASRDLPPGHLAQACLDDVLAFEDGAPRADDMTLMILRRGDRP